MIKTERPDDDVDRPTTALGPTTGVLSYAVPRPAQPRRRFVVPAAAVGLGLALGTAGLVVLQLL